MSDRCEGKVRYPNEQSAVREIKRIRKRAIDPGSLKGSRRSNAQ